MFHNSSEIQKPGFVWAYLKRFVSDDVVEEVQRLTLTKDNMAAVFDVPSNRVKVGSCMPKITQLLSGLYKERKPLPYLLCKGTNIYICYDS